VLACVNTGGVAGEPAVPRKQVWVTQQPPLGELRAHAPKRRSARHVEEDPRLFELQWRVQHAPREPQRETRAGQHEGKEGDRSNDPLTHWARLRAATSARASLGRPDTLRRRAR